MASNRITLPSRLRDAAVRCAFEGVVQTSKITLAVVEEAHKLFCQTRIQIAQSDLELPSCRAQGTRLAFAKAVSYDGCPVAVICRIACIPDAIIPQNVAAAVSTGTSVAISWDAIECDDTAVYTVEWSLAGVGAWAALPTTTSTSTSYSSVGGQTYDFRVKALCGTCESDYSDVVTLYVPDPLVWAIPFDDINDTGHILTTDLTTADVQTVGDGLSYSYWVYFPIFPSGNNVYFPTLKGEDPVGAGLQNWRLFNTLFTSGGVGGNFAHIVGVAFSGGSFTIFRRKERRYSGATIRGLLAGKWSHIVLNARRGNTLYPELYIDGVLQTPIAQTQDAGYTGTEWTQCTGTGASYGSAGLRFSNYYLLNKFADSVLSTLPMDYADILAIDGDFSAADITALYNGGCGDYAYENPGWSKVFRHVMNTTTPVVPDDFAQGHPLQTVGMPNPIVRVSGPC